MSPHRRQTPRYQTLRLIGAIFLCAALFTGPLIPEANAASAVAACNDAAEPGMTEVLKLDLLSDADYVDEPDYQLDERASFSGAVGRVMYCLAVDEEWVAASFDAPHPEPSLLGVPVNSSMSATGRLALTVSSNSEAVVTGVDMAGAIEFFPNRYTQEVSKGIVGGSSESYDIDDTQLDEAYGSMQLFVTDIESGDVSTVLAYNGFATSGGDDVGIGTAPDGSPDWTFAENAGQVTASLRVFASPSPGTVNDFGAMRTGAVVPRDIGEEQGRTILRGEAPGATRVRTQTYADGSVVQTSIAEVGIDDSFEVPLEVPAMRVSHSARLEVEVDGQWQRLATAADLVGGDVYLIQGQSNAVAKVHGDGPSLNHLASPWIRSFGSPWEQDVEGALLWNQATAEVALSYGSIGQWGMQLGSDLLLANDVPIAILNGARGAKQASYFQRNDEQPLDSETNYGRFLNRVQQAGLHEAVRAIGWYQGESDRNVPAEHEVMVNALFDDWLDDFGALRTIHQMQIHQGCGGLTTLPVREVQRSIALARAEVDLISTVALPEPIGCHFSPAGYVVLGQQVAHLYQRDVLGDRAPNGIDSPVATRADFVDSSATTIRVAFARGDEIVPMNDTSDFVLSDTNVTVTNVLAGIGYVDLVLDQAPTEGSTLSYIGLSAPFPTTLWGAGIAVFDGIEIGAVTTATPNCDDQLNLDDALLVLQFVTLQNDDAGGCPTDPQIAELHAAAGDVNSDGFTDLLDALVIAQCEAGVAHPICPAE